MENDPWNVRARSRFVCCAAATLAWKARRAFRKVLVVSISSKPCGAIWPHRRPAWSAAEQCASCLNHRAKASDPPGAPLDPAPCRPPTCRDVQQLAPQPPNADSDLLPDTFRRWFSARGWVPRAHQLALLQKARDDRSALLIAPTGAGKTLAGFLPTLVELLFPLPRGEWEVGAAASTRSTFRR